MLDINSWWYCSIFQVKNTHSTYFLSLKDAFKVHTCYRQFIHSFIKWINTQEYTFLNILKDYKEVVFLIMWVRIRQVVIWVMRYSLFFYLMLYHDTFWFLFHHFLLIFILWRNKCLVKLCIWPSSGNGISPSSLNSYFSFIFRFTALEDEAGWLILGFAITILISMLSVALPAIKGRVIKRLFHKRKIQSLLH